MDKQSYKFDLVATSFANRTASYQKPFSIILEEGDPRIALFRGNHSFKETLCATPTPGGHVAIETKIESDFDKDDISLEEIVVELELEEHVIQKLAGGGFTTLKSILAVGSDKLIKIEGIGEATATKVIEACNKYEEDYLSD